MTQSNAADRFSDGGPDAASRVAAEAGTGDAVAEDQAGAGGGGAVFTRIGRFLGGLFT